MAVVAAAAPAPAPAGAQLQQRGLSAGDLFRLAEEARSVGRFDDAESFYRALAADPDPEVRAEARFRRGMMLAERKRYRDAALIFRALLDEKPEAARVRLELARMMALVGDERAARREIRQVQAGGLPPDVAVVVDQFAAALRSPKRIGGSLELSLAPDSNVNRATDARTLDTVIAPLTLSSDARRRSGLGLQLSSQTFARVPIAGTLDLIPRLSGRGNVYRDTRFNDVSASALIGLQWRAGRDRISGSVGHSLRWYGGPLHARTTSASVEWLRPLGREAQLDANVAIAKAVYRNNSLQNGTIYDVSVTLERALGATRGVNLSVGGSRQTAEDPGYATVSASVSALTWRDVGDVTLFASVGSRRLVGDKPLFLFPRRREEWLLQASVGGIFRQLKVSGFSPLLRLRFERNISTVGIYDYKRVAAEIGISRGF